MNQPTDYAPYIEGLVARERRKRQARQHRALLAREAAERVVDLLREEYEITRARLFGSALVAERFHERSDVDLAVEGLRPEFYLKAWDLINRSEPEFVFDLVTPENVRSAIWQSVEEEGIDL
jgi:uncharacterized protein